MIGNDIVDLKFASFGKHWKSQRFLDKVFSVKEQKVIANSENSFRTLWALWTMKESAYKIHFRHHKKFFFAPLKIACQIRSATEGWVIINNNLYHSSSLITDEYIYTIARSGTPGNVISACDKLIKTDYATQHSESNRSVLNAFAELWICDVDTLAIRKNEAGVPSLYKNNIKQNVAFSITHHGQYYGYALAIS